MRKTQDNAETLYSEIAGRLRELGDPQVAIFTKNYLKSPYRFHGLRVPAMRKVARQYRNLEAKNVHGLFELLWNSENHEEMSTAIYLLANHPELHDMGLWNFLFPQLQRAQTWDHVDGLSCWVVGEILLRHSALANQLTKLARSANPWMRRLAIVSTLPLIKSGNIEFTLQLAERLVHDADIYVQKGAGWMLREAGKQNAAKVREFILIHQDMKACARAYATEKMLDLRQQIRTARSSQSSS